MIWFFVIVGGSIAASLLYAAYSSLRTDISLLERQLTWKHEDAQREIASLRAQLERAQARR